MATLTADDLERQMPDARQLLSDEPEMESSLHYMQLLLLVSCLEWAWRDRDDFFIGANLTIYFSRQQLKQRDFRGPDFFLVKNTTREPRNSWVVWEEDGRYPDLIIELLSDSTAQVDRVTKRELYAERFHTPEYFYFSPETLEFAGFRLNFNQYEPIAPNERGWLWSEALGLFLGIDNGKLRYFSWDGTLIPTPNEAAMQGIWKAEQEAQRAEQETQRAEQEAQRAEQEKARADRLAAKLRMLGINPDDP
ncbi:Uma2 family endonuclease [Thermosynechococcaceae cyanobacterium BACA0444]|uniref:Uma2 family endonuclease n=1 Tax=Pseudocalidococcus azoricus BACA0444 TaxID=2918990 RepID=A0AAE4JXH9_9CYAN|nr:Uma2 family endonuclease [Pseudocalidococcus azoricus]MDS3859919.1 Uma2 family endonuclease [Pseudocalidococcus azoricus BACA0444]